ncbi:Down syndrome cell adhesion molecule-like protein Dscam2, partial [Centruroides sculpturatus]|uniref:Down syndrome cell adhesion molecule-like protein Dscam2 n=1 Tax=Centruroides sculpturatus TaxID=218467 RepID=UPI000C6EEA54
MGILAYMDYRAPTLTLEPPSRLTFLNSTGGSAPCSVIGNPRPTVYWVTSDGTPVTNIPGLRTSLPNGTLYFPPFPSERYRQDIHSAVYRCVASNLVGKVGSRDVHVRAVVQQQYQVQVYDEFVIRGNTAVLRCQVPSYVRDYVIVTTWERQDGISIVSNIATGGRYSVLSNGELHIRHTIMSDFKSYRCATKHLLSGEIQMSRTSGRLIITDPQGTHPPRLSDTRVMVHVKQGSPAELTCVAQAYPLPTYRWYKKIKSRLIPIEQRVGLLVASGSLYFQQTNIRDSGIYICIVNNSAGEKRLESTLTVTAPLKAEIQPKRIVVDSDKSVTLTCNVSGYPIEGITWLKDQKPIMTNGGKVRLVSREVLRINSVGREDKGIYQCYARNGEDSAQAATELALGETSPVFLDTFIDKTTQPGPSVSLQCVATGTPLPQITWTLDGYPVPDNDRVRVGDYVSRSGNVVSHVNISSVRVEDGGHYVCTAANEVGDLRHSGRLNVYGPPHIRTMTDISVVAGENMVVQCRVAGYPIAHITWEKDGRRLPTNRRQQVFPNGTLFVEDVQRAEDEGSYSCTAQNAEGATAEGGMKIHVKEKPLIFPFTFPPETQKEGMKIRVVCTVSSGDPPFSITWLKDNQPISMQEDVTVRILGEDFSSLTIEKATPKHNGQYTCVVRNEAATVNYTAALTVHVPARWRIQPSDASVLVGRSVTLDCQAEGYPQPQIRWEKAIGVTARDYRPISTSYHYQIFENGSLTIQDVARDDAGYYLCQATNGIGSELSSVISLSVHESPRFETKFQTQMVKKKEDVTMTCSVTGDPPLTISWTRDKQPLVIENDPRIIGKCSSRTVIPNVEAILKLVEDSIRLWRERGDRDVEQILIYTNLIYLNRGQPIIERKRARILTNGSLQITDISDEDAGNYTCRVQNVYGADEIGFSLMVRANHMEGRVLPAPAVLNVVGATTTSLQLRWEHNSKYLSTKIKGKILMFIPQFTSFFCC